MADGQTLTIRVHCISHGTIRIAPSGEGPMMPRTEGRLQRVGAAEDIAYAVLYLASDEAAWLTGVVLNVDGGQDTRAVE